MTQSELLAMMDIAAEYGQPVPTLDDYAVALEALKPQPPRDVARWQARMFVQRARPPVGFWRRLGAFIYSVES